jgi:hypothetical protein
LDAVTLAVEGWVSIDPSRFGDGVLAAAIETFLAGAAPLNYGRNGNVGTLGKVTAITECGDHVVIAATLTTPPPGTALKDAYSKIAAGSIRGLAIDGSFSEDAATIARVIIVAATPIAGSGLLTTVGPSDAR